MGYNSPADVASGGCRRASTECFIPAHPRAAVVTDLSDHAVVLMKLREWHGLRRRRGGYGKSNNSDQSDHFGVLLCQPPGGARRLIKSDLDQTPAARF
jgi:hypothetical protein